MLSEQTIVTDDTIEKHLKQLTDSARIVTGSMKWSDEFTIRFRNCKIDYGDNCIGLIPYDSNDEKAKVVDYSDVVSTLMGHDHWNGYKGAIYNIAVILAPHPELSKIPYKLGYTPYNIHGVCSFSYS